MVHLLAEAQSVMLMSVVKPVLVAAAFGGWAWVASQLDKDANYFHLKREMWNLAHVGAVVVGFGMLLLVPFFFLGFPIMLLIVGGEVVGYAWYRNQQVPASARWTFDIKSYTRRFEDYQKAQVQRQSAIRLVDSQGKQVPVPQGEDPDVQAHEVLDKLLEFALPRQADRVDVAVDSRQAVLAVRIDGVPYPQPAAPPEAVLKMIDYVKKAAGLDVEDRRKRQVGQLKVETQTLGGHRLDVETAGSTRGLVMSLSIDAHLQVDIPYEKLGLLEMQREAFEAIRTERGKVVLIAAPPKQGTTTTLLSLLQTHDPYTTSIVSFTEEPDPDLEGISHKQLPAGISAADYNEQLAILLRSEPDIVYVSRLADEQTAKLIAEHAEYTRFYLPFAQPDTFKAVDAWIKQVGNHRAAGESLGAIFAQRLVRKLCPVCRTPYKPDPAALKKLNLPADKVTQLYNASGKVMHKDEAKPCEACHGIGYRGRMGVFEVMVLDDEGRQFIIGNQLERLRAHVRKQRMLLLQEAALAKVAYEGTTDIKEVARALGDKFGSGPNARSGAPIGRSQGKSKGSAS